MSLDFGKLEFSVSFNPTSAFPLDARCYFESLATAQAAAASATEAGRADSVYYYGQTLAVVENNVATLYIIQPNKTLQAVGKIDSELFVYDQSGNLTLKGLNEAQSGSVPSKNSSGGLDWVLPVDAYSKNETDTKISEAIAAAPHLRRKIINSIDEINVNAVNADKYIYMVPTGLQDDSNRYYEYIVISITDDENVETRVIEKVGSWDINLDNYATLDQLNEKVDKKEDHSLISTADLLKLSGIASGAEPNVINSVSSEFIIDMINNRQLQIQSVDVSKISGLEDLLATKVDKQAGYSLVSPTDREKLNALTFENNDLVISGAVNAENVKDLAAWITAHASGEDFVPGLSQNSLTNDLYNKLMSSVHIAQVNPNELTVDSQTKELGIVKIDLTKVTGLTDALNERASQTQVNDLSVQMESLSSRLSNYVEKQKYESDIEEIWDVLTWKNIE